VKIPECPPALNFFAGLCSVILGIVFCFSQCDYLWVIFCIVVGGINLVAGLREDEPT
jgi:hypothetical protein